MTENELIDETVDFYGEDPAGRRAKGVHGICEYITAEGRRCAVGRCLQGTLEYLESLDFEKILRKVKPEYTGFSKLFWNALQRLHDEDHHWGVKGLTDRGKKFVDKMKEGYL